MDGLKLKSFLITKKLKNKARNRIFLSSTFKKYDCRDINFTSSKNVNRDINSFHKMHDFLGLKILAIRKK